MVGQPRCDTGRVRRRAILIGIWFAGTALGMVVATVAVQLASAKVTDHPTAVVSRSDVVDELEAVRSTSTTSTSVKSDDHPGGDGSADGDGTDDGGSHESTPALGGDDHRGETSPTTARSAVSTPPASIPGPAAPTSTTVDDDLAPTSPTTVPTSESQQNVPGGWVRVRCEGEVITLLGASPSSGYTMQTVKQGPQEVEVAFAGGEIESRYKAHCDNGQVVFEVDEHED
jgi:hypothetical protein